MHVARFTYTSLMFFFPHIYFVVFALSQDLVDRSIVCQAVCHYVVRCVSLILLSFCKIKNYTVSIKLHNYLLSVCIKKSYIFL